MSINEITKTAVSAVIGGIIALLVQQNAKPLPATVQAIHGPVLARELATCTRILPDIDICAFGVLEKDYGHAVLECENGVCVWISNKQNHGLKVGSKVVLQFDAKVLKVVE
jgi:hypothetical protein